MQLILQMFYNFVHFIVVVVCLFLAFVEAFPAIKFATLPLSEDSLHSKKNAGLKTTQLGLFGNPVLGKYWHEHMLGYFDPSVWIKRFYPPCWVFHLSHLLFK